MKPPEIIFGTNEKKITHMKQWITTLHLFSENFFVIYKLICKLFFQHILFVFWLLFIVSLFPVTFVVTFPLFSLLLLLICFDFLIFLVTFLLLFSYFFVTSLLLSFCFLLLFSVPYFFITSDGMFFPPPKKCNFCFLGLLCYLFRIFICWLLLLVLFKSCLGSSATRVSFIIVNRYHGLVNNFW